MRSRFFAAALVLALSASTYAWPTPVRAQTDTGEIVVTVTDTKTGKPVVDARAMLLGPQVASSLTEAAGTIRYTDVPAGIYRIRVVKRGYDGAFSREFEVLSGRAVTLDVHLSPSSNGPQIIGTVVARSQVSVSSHDIGSDSPIRRISDSLEDALDKLAGVSITQDATDPNSTVTVSLNNHDESQTAITLDGIPLGAPGSAVNLRGLNTDLFSGASVSFNPTAGALGGGVNFRTLEPTQTWIETLSGTDGTYDRANYQIATTGSIGRLGIAAEHTWRGGNTPLTFQVFPDESGLTYAHGGESKSLGDFVKLRYALGDERTTIQATAIDANRWNSPICTQFTGPLPCGIGPGNANFGSYRLGYVTLQSLVGEVATTFSAYASGGANVANDTNRYVNAVLDPSLSVNGSNTRGIAYSMAISPGRNTITLSGTTYASQQTNFPEIGSPFQVSFTNGISADTYQLSDAYKLNNQLTVAPNFSLATTTGVGMSLLAGASATWRPRSTDAVNASLGFGSSQPGTNVNLSFSDPASARIDCSSGIVTVSGPGSQPAHQSALNADLNWSHQLKTGSFTLDLFRQTQAGQLVSALVNAASEPPNYFPTGYFGALQGVYDGATTCGASAVFNPANVYVNEPIGGTARLYQGVNFSGRFALGPYIVALPTYSLNEAILTQADALLLGAASPTIVGAQLPNRPLHRAGLTLDGYEPHSAIEFLANLQYTGANNQQNLPPYAILALGASRTVGPGRLTVFETNVFNTFGYDFAMDSYGVPLPLNGGGFLPTTGRPLAPRQLNFSYTVKIGAPPPGPAIATVAQLPKPSPTPTFQPLRLTLGTPPPGTDPLSVAATHPSCDADAQKLAAPALAELRAYASAYEAKQTPPPMKDFDVTAHPLANGSYYLEIRPKLPPRPPGQAGPGGRARGGFGGPGRRGGAGGGPPVGPPAGGGPIEVQSQPNPNAGANRGAAFRNNPQIEAFRASLACAYLSTWTPDEATAKGIVQQRGRFAIYYVPGTGIVVVRPAVLPQGGGSVGGAGAAPAASASPGPSPAPAR